MCTVICPKCNQPVTVTDGRGFVICCDEVIFVMTKRDVEIFFDAINNPSQPNEALKNATHDRKTQGEADDNN